jgi:hypothetical protein
MTTKTEAMNFLQRIAFESYDVTRNSVDGTHHFAMGVAVMAVVRVLIENSGNCRVLLED